MRQPQPRPRSESDARPEAGPEALFPEPEVMSASDVRQNFGSVVNRVARGEGRVVIEKHGTPAVGIVSIEDIRRLRQMDAVSSRRKRIVDDIRQHFRDVDPQEMERETDKSFEEMRQEDREARSRARAVRV